MAAKFDLIFEKLAESTKADPDPSTYRVEIATPDYAYGEALEIDELRRAVVALQNPDPQSFTTT